MKLRGSCGGDDCAPWTAGSLLLRVPARLLLSGRSARADRDLAAALACQPMQLGSVQVRGRQAMLDVPEASTEQMAKDWAISCDPVGEDFPNWIYPIPVDPNYGDPTYVHAILLTEALST